MTTTSTTTSPTAGTTAAGSAISVLSTDTLPTHPSQLPCGDCGRAWGAHTSDETGHGFVRPGLPQGYAFVDDLQASHRFALLVGGTQGAARVVHRIAPCHTDHLVRIESAPDAGEPATHWLRTTTIVALLAA